MTNLNAVKLVKGSGRVIFTTANNGADRATMDNSEGEFLGMSLDEARGRIAALVADGWRVAKAA